MYFGMQYIQEGLITDTVKKIKDHFKSKKSPQTQPKSKEVDIKDITVTTKKATAADLKSLYNGEGLCFEGLDLNDINKEEYHDRILKKLEDNGVVLKDKTVIYGVTGKEFNKVYDLEGTNAYDDDYHISIIPYSSCIFTSQDFAEMKNALKFRWFADVVDNNEYREYKKGRHKKTQNIQWLIDAYGE